MVSFSAVAKRYPGGQQALKSVTFSLEAGTLAFITGRSGAGKSTLLKLIPAIERPSAGTVLVGGQNVGALKRSAIPYLRRNVGLVFQDQKLLYDRTVFDNVMLPLAFSSHSPKATRRCHRTVLTWRSSSAAISAVSSPCAAPWRSRRSSCRERSARARWRARSTRTSPSSSRAAIHEG